MEQIRTTIFVVLLFGSTAFSSDALPQSSFNFSDLEAIYPPDVWRARPAKFAWIDAGFWGSGGELIAANCMGGEVLDEGLGAITYLCLTDGPNGPVGQVRVAGDAYLCDGGGPPVAIPDTQLGNPRFCLVPRTAEEKPTHPCPQSGNPINPISGVKHQREVDFDRVGSLLRIVRQYSSASKRRDRIGTLGRLWTHNYDWSLSAGSFARTSNSNRYRCLDGGYGLGSYVGYRDEHQVLRYRRRGICRPPTIANEPDTLANSDYAQVIRPDGTSEYFRFDTTAVDPRVGIADIGATNSLVQEVDSQSGELSGWKYIESGSKEYKFDTFGRLAGISENGMSVSLEYELSSAAGGDSNDFTLDRVTDNFGRQIVFSYQTVEDAQLLSQITDDDGNSYSYHYNIHNMLEHVDFPDGQGGSVRRTYHYEKPDLVSPAQDMSWALTGITDERGVRYASWDYDDAGRAISSENSLTGSLISKVSVDHSNNVANDTGSITLTNPLGLQTDYEFDMINGAKRVNEKNRLAHTNSGDPSVGCSPADRYTSFEASGYRDNATDWEGNVTDYDHNDRGLEVSRTEGLRWNNDQMNTTTVTTPETRTITTEWHPKFRLETRISKPDMVTDFFYDCDNGRLLEKKVWGNAQAPVYVSPVCS